MCSNFVVIYIRRFILTECVAIATCMLHIKSEQNALNFRPGQNCQERNKSQGHHLVKYSILYICTYIHRVVMVTDSRVLDK